MRSRQNRVLTPCGVARMMLRGIRANFAPGNRAVEVSRLVEYLQDLAMSRGMDAELSRDTAVSACQAQADAEWLDTIAAELEDAQGTNPEDGQAVVLEGRPDHAALAPADMAAGARSALRPEKVSNR